MSAEDLREEAEAYAAAYGLEITGCLGWGIHGRVWKVTVKGGTFSSVLKIHRRSGPYVRERDCYRRLQEMEVDSIGEVAVPVVVRTDEQWLAIEMTLVSRPFLLDFGTAWLDERPNFPPEVWEQGEAEAAEKFGEDWPEAQRIVRLLEVQTGVIMGDLHPGNLALR